jgi:hypothetical protein
MISEQHALTYNPCVAFNTSESAYAARARMAGLRRAAFWRQLGFPNCALATAARMEKRRQRKQLEELEALQQPALTRQPPSRTKRQDRLL